MSKDGLSFIASREALRRFGVFVRYVRSIGQILLAHPQKGQRNRREQSANNHE